MDDPNPIIEEYKRRALLAAAQGQLPANIAAPQVPDISQAPAPSLQAPQMANPMPSLAAPQQPQVSPSGPQVPQVTPVQTQAGPIKSFLQQFVHGAGQGLLTHVGLENDTQRQARVFGQQQGAAKQLSETALQGAQGDYYSGRNDALAQQNAPYDLTQTGIPGLTGTVPYKDAIKAITAHVTGQNQLATQQSRNEGNLATTQLKYGNGEQPGPLNTVIKDIGGRSLLMHKGTGEIIKDLGQSNSISTANARAEAQARYGLTNTMDDQGNPVSESRLAALQGGNPSVNFDAIKQFKSDQVGIGQYENILKNQISPNLGVLNDPTQRAIIAHTLSEAERNPGAIQALLTSGAQSGLSPQGAALTAGIMQGREFGGVARKYGGNMNGTEGLMNRIMSNQASPLNSEQLNRDLIQQDLNFTKQAGKVVSGLASHRQGGSAPQSQATHVFNPATGKIEAVSAQ